MKKLVFLTILFLAFFSFARACPPPGKVENSLKKLFPRVKGLRVEKIQSSPVPGFCEAVLGFSSGDRKIVYVDEAGRFCFVGRLYDLQRALNLTELSLAELNRLSPEELQELDKLVAFEVGKGKKTLYLITDPQCPFCRRLEKTLDGLIRDGLVRVKVILYPLVTLHPTAKEECISLICDRRGWKGLLSGSSSDHECEEGRRKVEEARRLLPRLGIKGTPAIVLPDGRVLPGAKSREQLLELLGVASGPKH